MRPMPNTRVRKQIVCPECGRVVKVIPVSGAAVEEEVLPDDETLDDLRTAGVSDGAVDLVVEEGPVCERCAAT